MTHSPDNLDHVKNYDGDLKIHSANGDSVPITVAGNISNSLPLYQVLYSPHLTTNYFSGGQLVENNCKISFSSSRYLV